jgi:hypothetical protein
VFDDNLYGICQTTDGGYIFGGDSYCGVGGNKTQPNWDTSFSTPDYWVVKIDANGHYLWDKRYGGTGNDFFNGMTATKDGGCIIGGWSGSGLNGDRTQPLWGGFDMWIVKIDSIGNKQWDKRYGGNGDESFNSIKQTKDGGYILGGGSASGISGDKTETDRNPGNFSNDYWIVKIDSAGNKLWDKRFGTIGDEVSSDVIQAPDGGYLIGGTCFYRDTSFDKTQVSFANGDNFWIVKTDSLGNKQWDRVYGGTSGETFSNSLNTADGNFMLGGNASSGVSGDKTAVNCGYWLVKIDTSGNKLGDWAFGTGTNCEQAFGSMSNTSDGGYLLTGTSGPVIGDDKTENNLSQVQVWTIKIDSQMHRVWDKTSLTLYTNGSYEHPGGVLESSHSQCYVIGVRTAAGVGGEKSQPNWDNSNNNFDFWVVEYCDSYPAGIQEPEGAMRLMVYPNPTTNDLSVSIQKDGIKEASYKLTNTSGQNIYQSTADNLGHAYTKILGLSGLPSGVYMLEVEVDGERIVRRVVKE